MNFEKDVVIYNSRDINFKSPFGACESGTLITYRMKIRKDLEPYGADLVVIFDKNNSGACYRMEQEPEVGEDEDFITYSVEIPIYDTGLYWYWFEFSNGYGRHQVKKSGMDNKAVLAGEHQCPWQQTIYKRKYRKPSFVEGGVYYHIFVDRFNHVGNYVEMPMKVTRTDWGGTPFYRADHNGRIWNNDFFGGNLRGIIEKLSYLQDLGVTCIYLSPIFEAFSNHKYDTADYLRVDPMFGTIDDFRELCTRADEMGMKVILDGVFSHTGSDSIYFDKEHKHIDGAYRNYWSPYRDWYYFHENETYETWWGIDTLPRVNKESESYTNFICGKNGVVRYWLRQGASGWRLDVVDELPNSFLEKLVAACKEEKEDSIIIGEVWEDASNKIAYSERKNYFEGDKLDSVMNYPFKNSIIDFVVNGNAEVIGNTVESVVENYPKEVVDQLMNNVGTHDTVRILTALGGRHMGTYMSKDYQADDRLIGYEYTLAKLKLKIASAIQFTLPGVPCIYYGDEAGMQGYADPFNRRCYPWGEEDEEILSWYRFLSHFRRDHRAYRDGHYRTVIARNGTYVFERYNDEEHIMTAANCGTTEETVNIQGKWENALTGEMYNDTLTVFPGALMLLIQRKF